MAGEFLVIANVGISRIEHVEAIILMSLSTFTLRSALSLLNSSPGQAPLMPCDMTS